MRPRLWPAGIRYIHLRSNREFLAVKKSAIDALADMGEIASRRSAPEVVDLPEVAHSVFITTGPAGKNTWNLQFGRGFPGVRLSWVSNAAGGQRWRNSLASPVMRKLVETSTLDVALGFADASPGGWLMVYKTLLFGHSILARLSWAYVYMKCMADFQMMRRITDALGERTVAWMRDIEECVRGHAPDGNAIR